MGGKSRRPTGTTKVAAPQTATEWKELGNELYRSSNFVEALQHYATAQQLDPDSCVYSLNIAAVHLAMKAYPLCLEECAKVLQHPNCEPLQRVKALCRMAKANQGLHQFEQSMQCYCDAASSSSSAASSSSSSGELALGTEVQDLLRTQLRPAMTSLGISDDIWSDSVVKPSHLMLQICSAVFSKDPQDESDHPVAQSAPGRDTDITQDVIANLRSLIVSEEPRTLFAILRSVHYLNWIRDICVANGCNVLDLDSRFPGAVAEAPIEQLRQPDGAALLGMHALLAPDRLDVRAAAQWFELAHLLQPSSVLAAWGRAACAAATQKPMESFQICVAQLVSLFTVSGKLSHSDRHTLWLVETLVDAAAQIETPVLQGPLLKLLIPFILSPMGLKLTTQVLQTIAGIKTKHTTFFEQLMDPFVSSGLCLSIDMAKGCVHQASINRTIILHRLMKEGRAQEDSGTFVVNDVFQAGCVLGCMAFNTDFALCSVPGFTPACEEDMLKTLKQVLSISPTPTAVIPMPILNFVVCLTMYEPLSIIGAMNPPLLDYLQSLATADHLSELPEAFHQLLKMSLVEPQEEHRIMHDLELVKAIQPANAHVQEFYDTIVYPKWRSVPSAGMYPTSVAERLLLQFPSVDVSALHDCCMMVAGTGSGLQVAAALKQYTHIKEVVGIDISARTLCYAHRQIKAVCSDTEWQRLRLIQGDITQLDESLLGRFGYIECFGCLHHLPNPEEGLRRLVSCLQSKGILALSLYSKAGRSFIEASHAYLRQKMPDLYGDAKMPKVVTAQDLRQIRQLLFMAPVNHPAHKCTETAELNSLAELRDLLFNPQEKRFTIREMKAMIISAGLQIIGLEPSKALMYSKQKITDIPGYADLDAWERLEARNPDLFRHMYLIYTQKM